MTQEEREILRATLAETRQALDPERLLEVARRADVLAMQVTDTNVRRHARRIGKRLGEAAWSFEALKVAAE
jgi:hypothetical protein